MNDNWDGVVSVDLSVFVESPVAGRGGATNGRHRPGSEDAHRLASRSLQAVGI